MKIVSFDEFVKLPVGTIYSDYEPYAVMGLFRRLDIIRDDDDRPIDYFYSPLLAQSDNCEEPTIDHTPFRWGTFDYDAQFVVYEEADRKQLAEVLLC